MRCFGDSIPARAQMISCYTKMGNFVWRQSCSDNYGLTYYNISMGYCKKGVTPLLTHWSYVFLALTHRYGDDVSDSASIKRHTRYKLYECLEMGWWCICHRTMHVRKTIVKLGFIVWFYVDQIKIKWYIVTRMWYMISSPATPTMCLEPNSENFQSRNVTLSMPSSSKK